MKLRTLIAATAGAAALAAAPAAGWAEDFNIGVSAALTGPVAGTYAPAVEGLRLYVDRLNAAGGIDGAKVRLAIQDDGGQPSKAAANVKQMLVQDQVDLLVNASLSSTFAPMIAESRRAGVPLLFGSSVCPPEVFPPAQAGLFCTTAFGAEYDSRAALAFIQGKSGTDVRLGLAAMAIPVSRGEIDYAEGLARELGMTPVDKEVVPPPTPDYTPIATKLKAAQPDWVWSWAPWVTEVKTLEGLRKLGWEGDYLAWAHIEAEGELARLKDGRFFVIGANALFSDDLPVQQEIRDAAKTGNSSYPAEQLTEGWIAGMAIEAALRKAGAAEADKIAAAMSDLTIDTKGLRGGPIVWTADNHFRTEQSYRVYRWNPQGDGIATVMDWKAYPVK